MERGGGAPSRDGDPTTESIIGAAIPLRRNAGRIPMWRGPCSAAFAAHTRRVGIDGQTNGAGRRPEMPVLARNSEEAAP